MDGEFDINTAVSTPTRLERIDILLLKISCETELKTNILPVIFPSSDCGAGVWSHTHTVRQKTQLNCRMFCFFFVLSLVFNWTLILFRLDAQMLCN